MSAQAAEFVLGASGSAATDTASSSSVAEPLFCEGTAGFFHEGDGFRLAWELGFTTEGVYPAPFLGDFYGPFSVDILEAGMSYSGGAFSLSLGKLPNRDVIESPYSLFVSGRDNRAMLAEIRYDDGFFLFEDRWMGLNRSLQGGLYASTDPDIYDDRGAVLKNYGFRFGKLRVGFQDVIVFTGSYFDLDAFANPAPGFFVQYVATAMGRPWSRTGNENSIMGFFADYSDDAFSIYAQVLVDDFNMNRFLDPDSFQNPDKMAFSFGGTWDSPIGKFGLYAAGATRYCFESIGGEYYSYTYYPGSAVLSDGSWVGIPRSSDYIGYVGGENNLSTMICFSRRAGELELAANLEFSLTGEQSPANPWHADETFPNGTYWLDDPVLEKKIAFSPSASWKLGSLTLSASGTIGWVANRLELVDVAVDSSGNKEPVWTPSDESGFLAAIRLGFTYRIKP